MSSVDLRTAVPAPLLSAGSIGLSTSSLPEKFPSVINGAAAWTSNTFNNNNEFVYHLTAAQIAELTQGLAKFKGTYLGLPILVTFAYPPAQQPCASSTVMMAYFFVLKKSTAKPQPCLLPLS